MPARDPLDQFVEAVFVGRPDDARAASPRRPVLPDGYVDVIWESGRTPWVAGPDTGPASSSVIDPSIMLRFQFRRARAAAVLGVDLSELCDRRVPLDGLWASPAWERLAGVDDTAIARQLLEDALRRRIPGRWSPDTTVEAVVRGHAVEGIGERQLRRRFRRAVGYGPKTYQRVIRFQRFIRLAEATPGPLAGLAAEAGYADQAHLTRETRRLSGLTPTAFLAA